MKLVIGSLEEGINGNPPISLLLIDFSPVFLNSEPLSPFGAHSQHFSDTYCNIQHCVLHTCVNVNFYVFISKSLRKMLVTILAQNKKNYGSPEKVK